MTKAYTKLSLGLLWCGTVFLSPLAVRAQSTNSLSAGNLLEGAQLHGDFQSDVQNYKADPNIGAPVVPEKIRNNNFANLIFTAGRFSAGARYEAYLPPLQGFDQRYYGQGVPYRYATYDAGKMAVTVGNFYEQFGSGLIFRAYEERSLGIDNSLDGVRVRLQPIRGLRLTGVIGKQRFFFDKAPAIVRGADVEFSLNDLFPSLDSAATRITIGGSFVSKYQTADNTTLVIPENVGAGAGRFSLSNGGFIFNAEYANKGNDPSVANNFIYRNGQALLVTTSYARNGFGVVLGAKRVDNMDFRTDRNGTGNLNRLNYLPALTKQHTYLLAASLYPYATQPLGEMSSQLEVTYHVPAGSFGGHYGTDLSLNLSGVNSIDKTDLTDAQKPKVLGYNSNFLAIGGTRYFRDYNLEVHRRFTRKLKANAMYAHFVYNKDVIEGVAGYGIITSDIGVIDVAYKLSTRHTIRGELQTLQTSRDKGSWMAALLEYTQSPHFFATVYDQYNYGNSDTSQQIHYLVGQIGYISGTTRIALGYGRQRAGYVCVGGVCRYVPASDGAILNITSSF